jgi:hypothetical protein
MFGNKHLPLLYAAGASCLMAAAFAVPQKLSGSAADAAAVHLLKSRCAVCHGGKSPAAGLRLDSAPLYSRQGKEGVLIVPGSPDTSGLIRSVHRSGSVRMPPDAPLPSKEQEVLAEWVRRGARWPGAADTLWSLKPLQKVRIPNVKNRAWVKTPVDGFVLSALEQRGLQPALPADRATLLRRAYLDLIGLPPTAEETAAFAKDRRADAWPRAVDRLLADRRYGERWARHWLDIARFSESQGFERDKLRDHAWRYRDWVVEAFNSDMPYRDFVQQQIAGDVLPNATPASITATGFLVCGSYDEVALNDTASPSVYGRAREEQLEEMIATIGQGFLGLTLNCARCHDHKFDPVTRLDYYRIRSALDGVKPGDRSLRTPAEESAVKASAARLASSAAEAEQAVADTETRSYYQAGGNVSTPLPPAPLYRWTFENGLRDTLNRVEGRTSGAAATRDGALALRAVGQSLETAALPTTLRAKTLEAWVRVTDTTLRGGSVLTVQRTNGSMFDAIVFAERQPLKWMAGSEGFRRTRDLTASEEKPGTVVQMAVTYADDGTIAVYRNGTPYGEPYRTGPLQTFGAGTWNVLIGQRHTGASGWFGGDVLEARIYNRALSPRQVLASWQTGVLRSPGDWMERLAAEDRETLKRKLETIDETRRQIAALMQPPLAYAVTPKDPEKPTHLLLRGDPMSPSDIVVPGGVEALSASAAGFGLPANAPDAPRRIALARWITDSNPAVSARVIVNRIWQWHFGRGIVGTPSDFGRNGEAPSHPKLLEWLAAAFLSPKTAADPWGCGGRLKPLHRILLLSSTYQQSSRPNPKAAQIDADNRLLWRWAPRRMEGEVVRDAMLAVSGSLNPGIGGPSFRPFLVESFNSNQYTLTEPDGPEFQRRTLYRMHVCSARSPLLEALDCPDPAGRAPQRLITTTPVQALEMMNGPFVQRIAGRLAELCRSRGATIQSQVSRAYRQILGRSPGTHELGEGAELCRTAGLQALCWALLNSTEFVTLR